jgi:hypothetical protein
MTAHPLPDDDAAPPAPPSPPVAPDAGLRVLLVDASDRGGIARYTRCLRDALQAEHAEVALAAPAGVGDPGLALRGPRWGPAVAAMGKARLYALRLGEVGPAAVALLRAVSRAAPAVVHAQTEVVPGLDALVLGRISRRVPVVLTLHDPVPLEGGGRAAPDQARRWRAADALIIHGEEPAPRASPSTSSPSTCPSEARPSGAPRPGPGSGSTPLPPPSCSARSGPTKASGCWPAPGPRWPPPYPGLGSSSWGRPMNRPT